jgi:hypothetical protein
VHKKPRIFGRILDSSKCIICSKNTCAKSASCIRWHHIRRNNAAWPVPWRRRDDDPHAIQNLHLLETLSGSKMIRRPDQRTRRPKTAAQPAPSHSASASLITQHSLLLHPPFHILPAVTHRPKVYIKYTCGNTPTQTLSRSLRWPTGGCGECTGLFSAPGSFAAFLEHHQKRPRNWPEYLHTHSD